MSRCLVYRCPVGWFTGVPVSCVQISRLAGVQVSRCLVYRCPGWLVYSCPGVLCTDVPVGWCAAFPVSCVQMSQLAGVQVSWLAGVPVSRCHVYRCPGWLVYSFPGVLLSKCRDDQVSSVLVFLYPSLEGYRCTILKEYRCTLDIQVSRVSAGC